MRRRHIIEDRRTEIAVGVVAFLAGSLLIRDAYDKRGQDVPWFARPLTWW